MTGRFSFLTLLFFVCSQCLCAQNISSQLGTLLQDKLFEDSDVSLAVCDLDADSMLFKYGEKKLCRPASVTKIVTAAVALERLGCDYTIKTRLYSKDNASGGVNLYVQGRLDPLFSVENLDTMLSVLPPRASVDTLFADCSFMDSVYWGPGWSWDDTPWEFQPYISPLMLNGGCVEITATPAAQGVAPTVECHPQSEFYSIANEAVSGVGSGDKFTILRDWLQNSNVIRLRGDCKTVKSEKMNMYPSQDFFLAVMREHLMARGIAVGSVCSASVPSDAAECHTVSRPIADVVAEALSESNNLCAEALSYHLGALYGRCPVQQHMGPKIIKSHLDYTLDMPQNYHIADGSGLSLYTYLSADIIMQVLRQIYTKKDIHDIFMSALPQAGVSGTMKHRCKGTSAYKNVYAKTGTVKGVCTLAGYARARNGHLLAFVVLNRNSMSARDVRKWQDKVCDVICNYR